MVKKIDPLTEYILNEDPKVTSVSVISQKTKLARTAGQLASNEAKKRNDPLYQRMTKYKELYFKYRELVQKKYGPRVRGKARR